MYLFNLFIKKRVLLVLGLLVWSAAAEAGSHPYARALVDIDDLCVVTSQMERDYAIEGMGVSQKASADRLARSEKLFKKEFSDVEKAKLSPALHQEVIGLQQNWNPILAILKAAPQKNQMTNLDAEVRTFASHCEKVAQDIQAKSDVSGSEDALLLSRYDVDTQRLAAIYMMKAWGVADANYSSEAKALLTKSSGVISKLRSSSQLSSTSKQRLQHIQTQFKLFEFMAVRDTKRFVPALMNKKADTIVNEVNAVLDKELAVLGIAGQMGFHEVKPC
jgi:hypothetical protein